jgi:hypothetical protein
VGQVTAARSTVVPTTVMHAAVLVVLAAAQFAWLAGLGYLVWRAG